MGLILSAVIAAGKEEQYEVSLDKPLRVGRSGPSDVVLSDDPAMSRLHFEVGFVSGSWQLQDLRSTNGTQLNGNRVERAFLKSGDIISAGKRNFTVNLAQQESAGTEGEPTTPVALPKAELLQWLRSHQPLYAVIDSARHPAIFSTLPHSKQEYFRLFGGEDSARLAQFAPFLVPLPPSSTVLDWLVETGWGKNWGILLISPIPPANLSFFLGALLRGMLTDRTEVLLRFYDPRVFKKLLSALTVRQARMLFDAVHMYIVEGDTPEIIQVYSQTAQGIQNLKLMLDGKEPPKLEVSQPRPSHVDLLSESHFPLTEEQVKLFKASEENGMEKSLLAELSESHGTEFQEIGPKLMEEYVKHGVSQAPRYGLRKYMHIRQYILLMMKLGKAFDTSPSLPWASRILNMRLNPAEKLARLNQSAKTFEPSKTQVIPMLKFPTKS